jgi:predicted NBD/HSP70 family sugar kinase
MVGVVFVNSADLRLGNARRVLAALLEGWPCTRPELARRTGLSAMTVGKVAEQLLELDLLAEAPGDSALAGRPPRQLSPSQRPRFLAVELGLHATQVQRLSLAGEVAGAAVQRVGRPADLASFQRDLQALGGLGSEPIEAVLVSVPGVLDGRGPAIVFSPNLHWTEGGELLRWLGAHFGAPVCAVQEAQALALGHAAAGGAPEHFLLVELGDGVGSAVVTGGKLLGGPLPLSGELGHTKVPGNLRRCGCGAIGCLETLAGRAGVLATAGEVARPAASWLDLVAAWRDGPLPPWLFATIDATAMVLAGALNLLGLREVVVVGEVAELHPALVPTLRDGLMAHSLLGRFGRVECTLAPARRRLGLLAAAVDRVLLPAAARARSR